MTIQLNEHEGKNTVIVIHIAGVLDLNKMDDRSKYLILNKDFDTIDLEGTANEGQ